MSTSASRSGSKGVTRAPRVAREPSATDVRREYAGKSVATNRSSPTLDRIDARIAEIERNNDRFGRNDPTNFWQDARATIQQALEAERAGDRTRAADLTHQAGLQLDAARRTDSAIRVARAAMRVAPDLAANRVGRNRVSPRFPAAAKSLDAMEKQLLQRTASDQREHGALHYADRNAKAIAERAGQAHTVGVPYSSARDSGLVFTHTHPSNTSFSESDLEIASSRGFAGFRAVTPSGDTYTIGPRPGRRWPSFEGAIKPAFESNANYYRAALTPLVRGGYFTDHQAGVYAVHLAWRAAARELGLIYSRQRSRR